MTSRKNQWQNAIKPHDTPSGLFLTEPRIVRKVAIDSYSIHYEIFGNGGPKIILVMGLLSSMGNFALMVEYFVEKSYQVLVLDNRGFGFSTGGAFERYTTQGMAHDVARVLSDAGWIQPFSLNLVGISMGGMIAQELVLMLPNRFRTVSLLATQASFEWFHHNPTLPIKMFSPKSGPDAKIHSIMDLLFSDEDWLSAHDSRFPEYTTNRERAFNHFKVLISKYKAPSLAAIFGQISAVITHNVSPKRLEKIGQLVPIVICVTGTDDAMIHKSKTDFIAEHIQCRKIILQKKGHGLISEAEMELFPILLELFENSKHLKINN